MSQFRVFHGFISACIHISGKDALAYLHSQMTVSIPNPESKEWVYGLWLNESGRVLADSYVFSQAHDSCLLWSYFCPSHQLIETIQRNLVADEVEITNLTQDLQFSVLREKAQPPDSLTELLETAGYSQVAETSVIEDEGYFQLRGSPISDTDVVFIADAAFHEELHRILKNHRSSIEMTPLQSEEFEYVRIANGVTAIPQDINHRNLPQEGLFSTPVIDHQKGCFPGQEIMANFRKSGRLNKQIAVFEFETTTETGRLEVPKTIYSGRIKVGELSSIAARGSHCVGLGLMRIRSEHTRLHLKTADGTTLSIRPFKHTEGNQA